MDKIFLILGLMALGVTPCFAGDAPVTTAPAEKPTSGTSLEVTVVSVSGHVDKLVTGKEGEKPKWTPVKPGEKLGELTVIRTGFRSEAVLKLADRGEVKLSSGTKIGIGEFRKEGRLVRTPLGLKYGMMRATVDSTRGPNDAKIVAPTATLSVRGTDGIIGFTGDRGLGLRGREGTWRVASGTRSLDIVPGEVTDGQLTPSIQIKQQQRFTLLGDLFGLSSGERQSLINNPPALNPSTPAGGRPVDTIISPTVPTDSISPPPNHIIIGM